MIRTIKALIGMVFPRAIADAKPAEPAPDGMPQLAGLKILVVDDEAIVLEVVAGMLELFGCTVLTADNGPKALELIESETPDALLLDFAMPGMNGAEVARETLARRPGTRIVFATGFAQSGAIDAAMGGDAILLRKPFSSGALAEALRRALA